jgi:hypothetical protein
MLVPLSPLALGTGLRDLTQVSVLCSCCAHPFNRRTRLLRDSAILHPRAAHNTPSHRKLASFVPLIFTPPHDVDAD